MQRNQKKLHTLASPVCSLTWFSIFLVHILCKAVVEKYAGKKWIRMLGFFLSGITQKSAGVCSSTVDKNGGHRSVPIECARRNWRTCLEQAIFTSIRALLIVAHMAQRALVQNACYNLYNSCH